MSLSINAHWHMNAAPQRRGRRRVPRLWFFTDDRLGRTNADILRRLPRGTGVVLRSATANPMPQWRQWAMICRARGLIFLVSGAPHAVGTLGAYGVHWPEASTPQRRIRSNDVMTCSAHGPSGVAKARRADVDVIFLSPIFATQSHVGAPSLGKVRFGLLARGEPLRIVALGGILPANVRAVLPFCEGGIAGISGWSHESQA
jgi:thiamine-phosphate pyrophosphorylase